MQRITDALAQAAELRLMVDDLRKSQAANQVGNGNALVVTFKADGPGVFIAAVCCALMLGMSLIGAIWMAREFDRYDDQLTELRQRDRVHDAYIQAAYRGDKKPEGK